METSNIAIDRSTESYSSRGLAFYASAMALVILAGCTSQLSQGAADNLTSTLPLGSGTHALTQGTSGKSLPSSSRLSVRARPNTGSSVATVYVAQFYLTSVNAYSHGKKVNRGPSCQINGVNHVNGLGVDKAGNLWVPEGTSIVEFAPNCGASGTVLTANGFPIDVAFDSKGDVIAATQDYPPSGLPGQLLVYANGSTTPTSILTDPSINLGFANAVDAHDNCYMSAGDTTGGSEVIEFPSCAMPGKILNLINLQVFIGGILFDSRGNLLVVSNTALDVYKPPFNKQPITITLKGSSVFCSLGAKEEQLYCGDTALGQVDVYHYEPSNPALTSYSYSWNNGLSPNGGVYGVAPAPAAQN